MTGLNNLQPSSPAPLPSTLNIVEPLSEKDISFLKNKHNTAYDNIDFLVLKCKGKESDKIPILNGSIWTVVSSYRLKALVDTGATFSFINEKFAQRLRDQGLIPHERPVELKISIADCSTIVSKSCVGLHLNISGEKTRYLFYVVPNLSHPIILGVDFLRKYSAKILMGYNGEEYVNQNTSVLSKEDVVLEPKSDSIVRCRVLSHRDLSSQEIGVKGDSYLQPDLSFPSASSMPTGRANNISVVIRNNSENPVALHKQQRLGSSVEACQIAPETSTGHDDSFIPMNCPEEMIRTIPKDGSKLKYKINPDLSPTQKSQLLEVLNRNRDAFVTHENIIGCKTDVEVDIILKKDAKPVNVKPYTLSAHRELILKELIDQQLERGIISKLEEPSPWNSSAFIVPKPGGDMKDAKSYRGVIDYRKVNSQIETFSYGFPKIDDLLNSIGQSKSHWYSSCDIASAYHQIRLSEKSKLITAFTANGIRYVYNTLPMGLNVSGLKFQDIMENCMIDHKYHRIAIYVDDLCCFSRTWEEHLEDLDKILKTIIKGNLKLKSEKCEFGYNQIDFLGFRLSKDGIAPTPNKLWPLKTLPVPTSKTEVKRFNGMAQFYKRFIRGFSKIMKPLYTLTRNEQPFVWSKECNEAFETIKKTISSEAVLAFPDFSKPFHVHTDASGLACGAILSQEDDMGLHRVIEMAGRNFSDQECRYGVTDRELLGIIFALQRFSYYLQGNHFTVWSDHTALVSLFNKKDNINSGRLARWVDRIMSFDFEVKFIAGKANVVADILSRRDYPKQPEEPPSILIEGQITLPPKQVRFDSLIMVKIFEKDELIPVYPILMGPPRSILKDGLSWNERATAAGYKPTGKYALKPKEKKPNQARSDVVFLRAITRNMTKAIDDIMVKKPTRTSNSSRPKSKQRKYKPQSRSAADKARRSLEFQLASSVESVIRDLSKHGVCNLTRRSISKAQKDDTYCNSIVKYMRSGSLPENNALAREILLTHDRYILIERCLFRLSKSNSGPPSPLLVIPESLIYSVIKAHHDHVLGGHLGVTRMSSLLASKYFCKNMQQHIVDYVGTCVKCLTTNKRPKYLKLPMKLRDPVTTPFTHVMCDTIGPLSKSDNKIFVHVCVDVSTKFIVSWATPDLTSEDFILGFMEKVVCVHGIPAYFLSDNGSIFTSKMMKGFCKKFNIKMVHGSPFHSESQGLVERYNQAIERSVRAFITACEEKWSIFLAPVVFALNNTISQATGVSPNMLVYGRHCTLPIDRSLNIPPFSEVSGTKDLLLQLEKTRTEQQNKALDSIIKVHSKMKEKHDLRAKHHKFEAGDYVFMYIPKILTPKVSRKLQPTHSGPYLILKVNSPSTVIIRRLQDGYLIKKPVHVERLRQLPKGVSKAAIFSRIEKGYTRSLLNPDTIATTRLSSKDIAFLNKNRGKKIKVRK